MFPPKIISFPNVSIDRKLDGSGIKRTRQTHRRCATLPAISFSDLYAPDESIPLRLPERRPPLVIIESKKQIHRRCATLPAIPYAELYGQDESMDHPSPGSKQSMALPSLGSDHHTAAPVVPQRRISIQSLHDKDKGEEGHPLTTILETPDMPQTLNHDRTPAKPKRHGANQHRRCASAECMLSFSVRRMSVEEPKKNAMAA